MDVCGSAVDLERGGCLGAAGGDGDGHQHGPGGPRQLVLHLPGIRPGGDERPLYSRRRHPRPGAVEDGRHGRGHGPGEGRLPGGLLGDDPQLRGLERRPLLRRRRRRPRRGAVADRRHGRGHGPGGGRRSRPRQRVPQCLRGRGHGLSDRRRRRPRRRAVDHGRHGRGHRPRQGHQPRARGLAAAPLAGHGRQPAAQRRRRRPRPGALDVRRHGRGHSDARGRQPRGRLLEPALLLGLGGCRRPARRPLRVPGRRWQPRLRAVDLRRHHGQHRPAR